MSGKSDPKNILYLGKFTSRKDNRFLNEIPDSLGDWMERYFQMAVKGVRSEAVSKKIVLHLQRFKKFFTEFYGHDRISTCLKRDVVAWQSSLREYGFAHSTINNHLASLSAFTTWVNAQDPNIFPSGDPVKGIGELRLPPLEPRSLTDEQVRSLKNLCDRLYRFYQLKGRRWSKKGEVPLMAHGRPYRDRAIVYILLSTGLRREELVILDFDQLIPNGPDSLRKARQARIVRVQGKGKTERTVFLSADARGALADYLERERLKDVNDLSKALFLSSMGIPARSPDGRLSPRAINLILSQIGRWHDSEVKDDSRKISPLRPHDLRHTFAFQLAKVTGADAYELERRLGHRSQRYIQRYTNPPEQVAASYVEEF